MAEQGNNSRYPLNFKKKFKNLFSNLLEPLLVILQKPCNKYNLKSVILYYSSFAITADFCLVGTVQKQVLKIMQDIKSSEPAGIDKLSLKFLKDGAAILAKPVSALCNLSVSRGVFSSVCKVVKLKPIFKKGKKTGLSECRLISLLPGISQIIGNVVHDQKNAFLSDENILYNYQSDFDLFNR